MARVKVKVEGLRELERALKDLPKATGKNVLRRVLTEGGEPIARAARGKAPVEVGYLREGIDVGTKLTRRQRGLHNRESPVEVFVGASGDPAAHIQEFGNEDNPPQPFMRPAWDSQKMKALDLISVRLGVEIDKAAARLARKAAKGKG
ncbi:HK97-gp10 family putative phage morphogenesis protein [Mongoliimonas terrestris]|uniref:HK97-gp10 family putative phage morphogenesis protein n=1 Tax=Mongoliimonas terrestris TaxID=1709001 RepID=UPI0009498408|nr:HK97-gp10 family putative phage morphogenesis protein [Mongoliimonas terrestris]